MKFLLKSIKGQLLTSFLTLIGFFFLTIIGVLYLINQANTIRSFRNQMADVDNCLEAVLTDELIFLQSEYNDFEFHETGHTPRLSTLKGKYEKLYMSINCLISHSNVRDFHMKSGIVQYRDMIEAHRKNFYQLVDLVRLRGVKDFGLIGNMRQYVHFIENHRQHLTLSEILLLRRHEKDYLLRHQAIYIEKLNSTIDFHLNYMRKANLEDAPEYKSLEHYKEAFNRLVKVYDSIENEQSTGVRDRLHQSIEELNQLAGELINITDEREDQLLADINTSFYIVLAGSLVVAIALSYLMARRRSKPIITFANILKKQTKDFHIEPIASNSIEGVSNELRTLITSYNKLVKNLMEQFDIVEAQNAQLTESNDELKKVNKELDNFVYRVSHDLRAPLASIMGIVSLNKMASTADELKENNGLVERCVLKMDAFIRDIINLSRNTRTEIRKEEIVLEKLLLEITDEYKYLSGDKQVEVSINISQRLPFISDFQRLKVVFSNLIANAFNYADRHKAKSYIKIIGEVDEEWLTLRFEDNGVGIHEKYICQIFDMFFRASYDSKGSGLGLYITKESLDKLHGFIDVESVEGVFTLFNVRVPNAFKTNRKMGSQRKISLPKLLSA